MVGRKDDGIVAFASVIRIRARWSPTVAGEKAACFGLQVIHILGWDKVILEIGMTF